MSRDSSICGFNLNNEPIRSPSAITKAVWPECPNGSCPLINSASIPELSKKARTSPLTEKKSSSFLPYGDLRSKPGKTSPAKTSFSECSSDPDPSISTSLEKTLPISKTRMGFLQPERIEFSSDFSIPGSMLVRMHDCSLLIGFERRKGLALGSSSERDN